MIYPKYSTWNTTLHEVTINYLISHILEKAEDNHSGLHKRIAGRRVPDIITPESYIEVETISDKQFYETVTDKKRILYITVQTIEAFDEINLLSVAPIKSLQGVYDFKTIYNIPSEKIIHAKENTTTAFESKLIQRRQKDLEDIVKRATEETEELEKLYKKHNKKIPKLELDVEELETTVKKLGKNLYALKRKQTDLNETVENAKIELSQTRDTLKQLNEKQADLSEEEKQLFWIKLKLGNVELEHKSIFDCCLCDERSTIGIVVNNKEYGLCDFHFKKVKGK